MKWGKLYCLIILSVISSSVFAGQYWSIAGDSGGVESKVIPDLSGTATSSTNDYSYFDSSHPFGPVYNYISMDITDAVFLNSQINYNTKGVLINIGFSFPFYNKNYTQLIVNDNGYLTFDLSNPASCCVDEGGDRMPSTSGDNDEPKALIAGMWGTNLWSNASLYKKILGTSPNRMLVIELRNYNYYSNDNDETSYQFHLYENGNIEIHYKSVDTTSGDGDVWYMERAIGIEDVTETKGLTYFLGYPSDLTSSRITSGLAILFTQNVSPTQVYLSRLLEDEKEKKDDSITDGSGSMNPMFFIVFGLLALIRFRVKFG